jgi:hypothetical protein
MLVPVSENLAILGNISSFDSLQSIEDYDNFLEYVSKGWKNIYLVPGPYEYSCRYPRPYYELYTEFVSVKHKYKNITILNNSNLHLPKTNICLVGSTLWTKNPYYRLSCCYEFSYIHKVNKHGILGQILGNDLNDWFYEDLTHIKHTLKGNVEHDSIILTHHLPTFYLTEPTIKSRMEASDLENIFKKSIPIWLGGAGNKTISGTFGLTKDTFCAVNTYTTFDKPEKINTNYDPKAYVSLRTNSIELV